MNVGSLKCIRNALLFGEDQPFISTNCGYKWNALKVCAVFLIMPLPPTDKTFRGMLYSTGSAIALIPATRHHIQDSENVQRASDVALLAKVNGIRACILEGRGAATALRELLVLVVGNEAQVVGFARKVVREADAAANWFLFCRPGGALLRENPDWRQFKCDLESDGFTLPDGFEFKFGAAWGHWSHGDNLAGGQVAEIARIA